ncbi:hypothetical protein SCP_1200270 [Sparassis crispa]|uniref:XLF-like N-terminal domain-containing protein n=1 Tax=Sparassis crispa TaxID=139825 RepID=A0A401H076_9APHY|nr:hypothetical protein SCP_1200270 [Sparassis crispa]GBE87802.1 hypothetical protein SCP_1200270 [Sparassis crispa]
MEYLSEDHYKLLLNKEWLVRIDSEKSIPYLLKFYSSTVDQCCCIMITDTKGVWGEVLSSKQFARRWRDCNPQSSSMFITTEEEDEWRTSTLELVSSAHTLGGILDLSFDIVDSRYADFAFELGSDAFKWRWETYNVGPKVSADLISKHLIMPLISVTHLAFSSADTISELSEVNLEKAVDKVGRTARRTVDTHVKNAISRPRVATTLRRMTAIFNFLPELPSISSSVERPNLLSPPQRSRAPSKPPQDRLLGSPVVPAHGTRPSARFPPGSQSPSSQNLPPKQAADDDSATEQSDDDVPPPQKEKGKAKDLKVQNHILPSALASRSGSPTRVSSKSQPTPDKSGSQEQAPGDGSSPEPVSKRVKRAPVVSSSDEDSEAERRRRVVQIKGGVQRGAKQPLKRGGRRF